MVEREKEGDLSIDRLIEREIYKLRNGKREKAREREGEREREREREKKQM